MLNKLYIFVIALFVILADQVSKYIIFKELMLGQQIPVIQGILSIIKIYNSGAAFSLLQDKTVILTIFSALASLVIIIYLIKKPPMLDYRLVLGWGFILGGTIGNFLDRLRLGYVIDFIKLDFVNFPIFNIADMAINIGAFIIILYIIYSYAKPPKYS